MYLTCLPFLWMTGLTLPVAFLVVFGTFLFYVRSIRALTCALPWFAVGLSQAFSVAVNWTSTSQGPGTLLKHMVASYVSGWFLAGAAIGIGASGLIRAPEVLKSIVRISLYSIALALPAYLLAFYLHTESLFILSPAGHLVPPTFASRNFAFGIFVYNWEALGGTPLPRLCMMFPWPTAMGTAGVCMTLIVVNVRDKVRRRWGMAGGVLMVLASLGRLAFLAMILCLLLRRFLDWNRTNQILGACIVLLLIVAVIFTTGDLSNAIGSISDRFNNTRAGASEVRNAVYEQSWAGFYKSPWLGHGWPGEALVDGEKVYDTDAGMVVGSHSTVSGLLYKGGVITFSLFVLSFLGTVVAVARQSDDTLVKNTLVLLLAIGATCVGEGLESLVLPLLFVFFWIGVSLRKQPANR